MSDRLGKFSSPYTNHWQLGCKARSRDWRPRAPNDPGKPHDSGCEWRFSRPNDSRLANHTLQIAEFSI